MSLKVKEGLKIWQPKILISCRSIISVGCYRTIVHVWRVHSFEFKICMGTWCIFSAELMWGRLHTRSKPNLYLLKMAKNLENISMLHQNGLVSIFSASQPGQYCSSSFVRSSAFLYYLHDGLADRRRSLGRTTPRPLKKERPYITTFDNAYPKQRTSRLRAEEISSSTMLWNAKDAAEEKALGWMASMTSHCLTFSLRFRGAKKRQRVACLRKERCTHFVMHEEVLDVCETAGALFVLCCNGPHNSCFSGRKSKGFF